MRSTSLEHAHISEASVNKSELVDSIAEGAGLSGPHRYSLYKGELGAALLAADLAKPEASALPLFESEQWPPRIGH